MERITINQVIDSHINFSISYVFTMSVKKALLISLLVLLFGKIARTQPCVQKLQSGHQVLTSSEGCTPFYYQVQNLFKHSTPNTVYTVNWGDGTIETFTGSDDAVDYTPDFEHTYMPNSTSNECGYQVTIEATNDCTEPGDAGLSLNVSVWDTDQQGLNLSPSTVRVCQGFAADVTFTDLSDWNCFPRGTYQNNPPRWIQWNYIGGEIENTLTGSQSIVLPVFATGEQSEGVHVDPTNSLGVPYNVGDEFIVELRNWNYCNPYDDPLTTTITPDPFNKDPGETAPVLTTARIVIVETPNPDFQTRKNNASGILQNGFCVGSPIYFDNLTPHSNDLVYTWEFFDDEAGTVLLDTKTGRYPTYSFSSGGKKSIRLNVRNKGVVGNCETQYVGNVFIYPTPVADIKAVDPNDGAEAEITPFFCQSNNESFDVKFIDISTGWNNNTVWKWFFYDETGALIEESAELDKGGSYVRDYTRSYSRPGNYKVELKVWDKTVSECATTDLLYVKIVEQPTPDFSFSSVCEGGLTEFTDLSSSSADIINKWEWDLSYDGSTFIAEETFDDAMPSSFEYQFAAGGVQKVALRITTKTAGCTNMKSKDVEVYNLPLASFDPSISSGCTPLNVDFQNTSAVSQSTAIENYEWFVDLGNGFTSAAIQDPLAPDFKNFYTYKFENKGLDADTFFITMRAKSVNGCITRADTSSIIAYPSLQAGMSSDYNLLNQNCSPVAVNFEANQFTPPINPQHYRWIIKDANGVVKDTMIVGTEEAFSYEFINKNHNSKSYKVILEIQKDDYCFKNPSENIVVNPVPSAEFTAEALQESCNFMTYEFDARSRDLLYEWNINGLPYFTESQEIVFPRPESNTRDSVITANLKTTDVISGCESVPVTKDVSIPKKENYFVNINLAQINNGCEPLIAEFENISSNLPDSTVYSLLISREGEEYEIKQPWSGDINSTFSFKFDSAGVYQVSISAETPSGCTFISTPSKILNVFPKAVSDFRMDLSEGCAPLEVSLENLSTGNTGSNSGWFYRVSGETNLVKFSSEVNTSHRFYNYESTNIDYELIYVAENQYGCIDSSRQIVTVFPGAEANFTISPLSEECGPIELTFTNQNVKSNTDYIWNWGDGEPNDTTSQENLLRHTFTNNSTNITKSYQVTLKAIDQNSGCENTKQQSVKIYPTISIDAKPDVDYGCSPVAVNFENSSKGVTEHLWYYRPLGSNDKFEIAAAEDISYEFENTSSDSVVYEVLYYARNSYGCNTSDTFNIKVYPAVEASFTANPQKQVLPSSTVSIYNGFKQPGWKYSWDYGDGSAIKNDLEPGPYTYETYGVYDITLKVEYGVCRDELTRTVVIEPVMPLVEFDCNPKSGCRPLTVQFENQSSFADSDSYIWDFGDNQGYSNAKNPTYTYYEPGTYTVKLTASNKIGARVEKIKKQIITVHEDPYAAFRVNPTEVYLPDKPIYTTNLSFGANSYQWNFGDGTTSEEFEPEHIYTEAGKKDITLIAISENGCRDSVTMTGAVEAIEGGNIMIPNVFTPNESGPVGTGGVSNSNDVFLPLSEGVTSFHMQIFNRWGEMMFESSDRNRGWDGYYKGKLCPADVYIYKITLRYITGETRTKLGDVTLLR